MFSANGRSAAVTAGLGGLSRRTAWGHFSRYLAPDEFEALRRHAGATLAAVNEADRAAGIAPRGPGPGAAARRERPEGPGRR